MSQPATSTSAFAATRANAGIGCCASILSAPLCLSPATTRIATNGNRNAAASSHALNVGAQTPMSGENASPTPTAVPFSPLASAYVCTALMNDTPTSGPMSSSITHHARDDRSSRHSLARRTRNGLTAEPAEPAERSLFFAVFAAFAFLVVSGERKEDLFEIRGRGRRPHPCPRRELGDRAFAADATVAQEDETIADARGVGDLVDRQKQRPPGLRVRAQRGRQLARLAQVEAVERLVGQQDRLRHQQADRQQRALALTFRQRADGRIEDGRQIELADDFVAPIGAAEEIDGEL